MRRRLSGTPLFRQISFLNPGCDRLGDRAAGVHESCELTWRAMDRPDRGFSLAALSMLLLCTVTALLMLDALRAQRTPQVRFTVLGGEAISMEQLVGNPLVVNFWATTCSICRVEMPKLAALYRELHPHGLQVIGVAMPYDPPNLVADYLRHASIPYPVALDIDARIVEAFDGVVVTPTTFLIKPNGVIRTRREGRIDFRDLRGQILRLLPAPSRQSPANPQPGPGGTPDQIAMRGRP
jgi:thiol-disulfide isomerase/thioredoxin